nr:TylF/MycF/NovP-related O-methyltransferase [Kineosporia mesophila]
MTRPVPPVPQGLDRAVNRLNKATARLEKLALAQPPASPTASAAPAAAKAPAQPKEKPLPRDFDDEARDIVTAVRPYTAASNEKLHALITAARHLHDHRVDGAVVQCGVGRGGSMQAVARTLLAAGERNRDLFLFDTFGAVESVDEVRAGLAAVPYPDEHVHLVPGKVDDTLPQHAPDAIALLHLDTEWYSSTRHELDHLYPRLVSGGVLLLDDYGWWQGSRQATDEWLRENGIDLLLWRAGNGRVAIKP